MLDLSPPRTRLGRGRGCLRVGKGRGGRWVPPSAGGGQGDGGRKPPLSPKCPVLVLWGQRGPVPCAHPPAAQPRRGSAPVLGRLSQHRLAGLGSGLGSGHPEQGGEAGTALG